MRSRLLWLFAAVALIAAPSPDGRSAPPATFGSITDESGAVLPGVTVTLARPGGAGHADDGVERVGRLPVPEPGAWHL